VTRRLQRAGNSARQASGHGATTGSRHRATGAGVRGGGERRPGHGTERWRHRAGPGIGRRTPAVARRHGRADGTTPGEPEAQRHRKEPKRGGGRGTWRAPGSRERRERTGRDAAVASTAGCGTDQLRLDGSAAGNAGTEATSPGDRPAPLGEPERESQTHGNPGGQTADGTGDGTRGREHERWNGRQRTADESSREPPATVTHPPHRRRSGEQGARTPGA
jgi:hypothetical protein